MRVGKKGNGLVRKIGRRGVILRSCELCLWSILEGLNVAMAVGKLTEKQLLIEQVAWMCGGNGWDSAYS